MKVIRGRVWIASVYALLGFFVGFSGGAYITRRDRQATIVSAGEPKTIIVSSQLDIPIARHYSSSSDSRTIKEKVAAALCKFPPHVREDALRELGMSLSAKEIPEFVRLLRDNSRADSGVTTQPVIRFMLARLARERPMEAIELALSSPQMHERTRSIQAVLGVWGEVEPEESIQWVKGLRPGRQRSEAAAALVSTLAYIDPARALDLVALSGSPAQKSALEALVFRGWAEKDPVSASIAAGERLRSGNGRIARDIASAWAVTDVQAAISWVRSLRFGDAKYEGFSGIAASWAKTSPEAAARFVLTDMQLGHRGALVSSVATEWASKNPTDAMQWMASLDRGPIRDEGFQAVLREWAQQDPEAAAPYVFEIHDIAKRGEVLRQLSREWAEREPLAALEWAKQLPEDSKRTVAKDLSLAILHQDPTAAIEFVTSLSDGSLSNWLLPDLTEQWVQNSPDEAIQFVKDLPPGDTRDRAMARVVDSWAMSDPNGAATAVAQMPAGKEREEAMRKLIGNWITISPENTVAWLSHLPAGDEQNSLVRTAVQSWAQHSPYEAAVFVANLKIPEVQRDAATSVLYSWAAADPASALSWATRFPSGTVREEAIDTALLSWAYHDPSRALEWAAGMGSQRDQQRQIETVLRDWVARDSGAVAKWLQDSRLTESEKMRLSGRFLNNKR